jgi:hypothetical protein
MFKVWSTSAYPLGNNRCISGVSLRVGQEDPALLFFGIQKNYTNSSQHFLYKKFIFFKNVNLFIILGHLIV